MKPLFLIGYMGSGKTTLGRLLADTLSVPFIDLDIYIEQRFRKTINNLFAERGEGEFRQIEQRILHEVGEFTDVIVATGGGTPCFFDNIQFMCDKGVPIYLKTSIQTLFNRLRKSSSTRPLLHNKTDEELWQFINENLNKRLPFYEQATLIFDADYLESPEQIDDSLIRLKALIRDHTLETLTS